MMMMMMRPTFLLAAAVALMMARGCDAGTQHFWHLTDTHENRDYLEGSDPKHGCYKGTGAAGRFGDHACDTPPGVVASSFALMSAQEMPQKPAFILWTGDMVPHAEKIVGYLPASVEHYVSNVTEYLRRAAAALGNCRVFPILGNHDSFPPHYATTEDWWMYFVAADLWKDFLNHDALETLRKHGRYAENATEDGRLRIIAVNTVLYYSNNHIVPESLTDPGGQFAWIRSELAKARAAKQRVYIIGHLPPGYSEFSDNSSVLKSVWTDRFAATLDGFHDIVAGSFWGHVHSDSWKIWTDSKNPASASPVFLTPSLEPEGRDAAVRLFSFDDTSFDVADYTDFWYDVETANKLGRLEWSVKYTAKKAYAMANFTAAGMADFLARMETDDELFQLYNRNIRGMPTAAKCTGVCKRRALCALKTVHSADYEVCMET